MIKDSSTLQKGQNLRVEIGEVKDRLPQNILELIREDPIVELVGYKMVDGNEFGLVVKFRNGEINWFFEKELSEIMWIKPIISKVKFLYKQKIHLEPIDDK